MICARSGSQVAVRRTLDESGTVLAANAWWARHGTDTPVLVDLLGATDPHAAVELIVRSRAEFGLDSAEFNGHPDGLPRGGSGGPVVWHAG